MLHVRKLTHFLVSGHPLSSAASTAVHRLPQSPSPPPTPLADYVALRDKVDSFATAVGRRRKADLHCQAGCAACCQVDLTVSAVEAAAIRSHLAALAKSERAEIEASLRAAATTTAVRCVMLRADDRCAIYAARPLVCRSQGLPLLYPQELVEKAAQRGVTADGKALTCCPLNFTDSSRPALAADTLDAERVDVLLAVVNRRYAGATAAPPLQRDRLTDLAREFVR
jgi:hypothetical protein